MVDAAIRSTALAASERVKLFDYLRKHDFQVIANLLADIPGRFMNRGFDAGLNNDLNLVGQSLRELSARLVILEIGLQRRPMAPLGALPDRSTATGDDRVVEQWNRLPGIVARRTRLAVVGILPYGWHSLAVLENLLEPVESIAQ